MQPSPGIAIPGLTFFVGGSNGGASNARQHRAAADGIAATNAFRRGAIGEKFLSAKQPGAASATLSSQAGATAGLARFFVVFAATHFLLDAAPLD
jgi:hypothetical protein